MAIKKNTNDLLSQAATTLADNSTQDITPQDVREMAENNAFSSYNKITDNNLVGLKNYSTAATYEAAQGVVYNGSIYISNTIPTPGAFNPSEWDILLGGEVNTSSNSGTGEGLALAKSGSNLPFKSLTAGTGITLTSAANELQISSAGGTDTNIGNANINFDANRYADLNGNDWSIKEGSNTLFLIPSNGKMRMTSPTGTSADYILTVDNRNGGYGLSVVQGTNTGLSVEGSNNNVFRTYNYSSKDRITFGGGSNNGNFLVNIFEEGIDVGGGRNINFITQSGGASYGAVGLGYKTNMGVLYGYGKGLEMYLSNSVIHTFNIDGTTIFNGSAVIGTEKISLQDDTLIKGSDNAEATSGLKVTDINNDLLFDIRNNGQIGYGGAKDNLYAHKFRNPNNEARIASFDDDTAGTESFIIQTNGRFYSEQFGQAVFSSYRQAGQSFAKVYDAGVESIRLGKQGSFINGALRVGGVSGSTTGTTGARFEIQQQSTNTYQQLFFANARVVTLGRINSSGSFNADQKGLECYDTDVNKKFFWNGSAWEKIKGNIESVSQATATTLTPNIDVSAMEILSSLAAALTIAAPTGTPHEGQELTFRFKDDGTARALTWNAIFEDYTGSLPTTTTAGKTVYIGCKYNLINTKWDVLAVQTQP